MFFRRETPHTPTFDERVSGLKRVGFSVNPESSGGVRAVRYGMAAIVKDMGDGKVGVTKAGILVGSEIAHMVHGGYQMFFQTASGKKLPALADQLTTLHAFDEDLREGLGLTSLYNLSLGTTTEAHLYDRVADRDHPQGLRPWEKKAAARP